MLTRSFHTSRNLLNNKSAFGSIKEVFNDASKIGQQQQQQQQNKRTTIDDRFIPTFLNKKTYDPFDFSISSQRYQNKVFKTQLSQHMKLSSFNTNEINPLDFYTMPHLLNSYMNVSGQILNRSVTGLSARKQKQMAKAIRRARAFGLMSSVAKDVSTFPKRGSSL